MVALLKNGNIEGSMLGRERNGQKRLETTVT